ncbi:hypothetical protein K438DRAFT_1771829 [Mycena galopus ATCC 62051]|nr:hypothetical protein K438DRAFT_1771829 [Mycena galopus ATCC 62051]
MSDTNTKHKSNSDCESDSDSFQSLGDRAAAAETNSEFPVSVLAGRPIDFSSVKADYAVLVSALRKCLSSSNKGDLLEDRLREWAVGKTSAKANRPRPTLTVAMDLEDQTIKKHSGIWARRKLAGWRRCGSRGGRRS